jgi:TonB-linked SusC/RagA family outer membrane protein
MRKLTFLLTFLLFVAFQASAQMTISGKVTNEKTGEPIPGASIVVQGQTTIGTTTNMDGNYTLKGVPSNAETLVFSFVGMQEKEVPINGRTTIDVTLKPTVKEMEEVVVTALGISKEKKNLGYSVSDVSGDELNDASQSDAISSLQGRVSGVQIRSSSNMGGSSNMLIRGATSLTGSSQPLIVVDGVPIDNSNYNSTGTQAGYGGYDYGNMLNDINPSNIKSISVLKGSAAALYGSRAANGVLLIETKSGQKGEEKFKVEVNSTTDFEQRYLMPELQDKYGGGGVFGTATINGQDYQTVPYAVDQSWGPRYEGQQVLHWDAFSKESYPDQYLQTRPWKATDHGVLDFYELGTSFKNNISVTKTGKDYSVRFSYANTTTEGTVPNSKQQKNNLQLVANMDLTDKFTIKGDIKYMDHYTKGRPQIGYGNESVGQKFFQWGQRQLDYERLEDYKNDDGTQRTWNRKAWDNPTPKYADNPYWSVYENYPEDTRKRFIGSFGITYDIAEFLTAEANIYGDTYDFYQRERRSVGSQAQPYYSEMVRNNSEFNYEGRLAFDKDFDQISVSGILGGNIRELEYNSNYGETQGGLTVPDLYTLNNSVQDPSLNDYTEELLEKSIFLQASFNYGGFINIEGSIRNDWSSTLPEDENSYMYYGASGSFIFSELIDLAWLDFGKIRGGITQVGSATDPYQVQNTYSYHSDGTFGAAPRLLMGAQLNNQNLKPEITTSNEIGIDLTVLDNRLNLSATYFDKVTENLIFPLEVSKATGYNEKVVNAGELSNSGIELEVSGSPVKTKAFEWNIGVNFSSTEQIVNELTQGIEAIDIVRAPFGGAFLRASEGDEYGQLWAYDYKKTEDGERILNGPGGTYVPTGDLVPVGSVYPDYTIGINNSFNYKNWNFGFLVDIQEGGSFYSLSHMWGMYSGMWQATAQTNDKGNNIREPVSEGGGILLDGVYEDPSSGEYVENEQYTPGKTWSKMHYHGLGAPSVQSVFDASYIKVREITLGYTFNKELFGGTVKKARISAYARNVFTFGLDLKGLDPEVTVAGSGAIQGIEGGFQPISRNFGLNLSLTF